MKTLFLITIILINLLSPRLIFADQISSGYTNTVSVSKLPGLFDKLEEKITLFFKFNKADKISYYQYLLDKRLAEIKYVVDAKQLDNIAPTASRYETYTGNLTNQLSASTPQEQKSSLLSMSQRHIQSLKSLQGNFDYDSAWWLVLQHDMNVETILQQKLNSN